MSEKITQDRSDNPELRRLLTELELQIEGVNDGMSKIRGTVARISYAAFGSVTPAVPSPWGANPSGASAGQSESQAAAGTEESNPEPEIVTSQADAMQTLPESVAEPEEPVSAPEPSEPELGIWNSVADGASWPRARATVEPEPAPLADSEWSWPGSPRVTTHDAAPSSPVDASTAPADDYVESAELPEVAASGETVEAVTAETTAIDAAGRIDQAEGEPDESPTAGLPPDMPKTLTGGWPDESSWSQGFEWPAMKTGPRAGALPQPTPDESHIDESHIDVSDIVAQVKAELEAARLAGGDMTAYEFDESPGNERDASEAASDEQVNLYSGEPVDEVADEARREEVSRAVAEMRQQLESGNFEEVLRERGNESRVWDDAPLDASVDQSNAAAVPEEGARADVRRAVEATREELGAPGKPAFRLAAPGSIPDWSHVQMVPSGPPVVVMKDVDGRVELASVYETLNELGCGEGAALLNYTPHSVTVGLPISAAVPSEERVAEAVEKVFGLSSRVESDGVRITVNIGESPKRRSVDAA